LSSHAARSDRGITKKNHLSALSAQMHHFNTRSTDGLFFLFTARMPCEELEYRFTLPQSGQTPATSAERGGFYHTAADHCPCLAYEAPGWLYFAVKARIFTV
jgi:hypothetical protein